TPGGHYPRAVRVAEKDVVEVGDEAERCVPVGVRAWRARQVEDLSAFLIAKGAKLGAQAIEHRTHGEPRPCTHVGGRSRSEGGKVARDQPFGFDGRSGGNTDPGFKGRG